jgi:transcriptional antiterminator RfaH
MSGAGWYLIFLTAGSEVKARDALRAEGLTVFLPEFVTSVHHDHVVRVVTRPLFPRYLFARLAPQRGDFARVRKTRDVTLVSFDGSPQIVPEQVIRGVSWGCDSGAFDSLPAGSGARAEDFPQGASVKVDDNPFGEIIGKIKAQPRGKRAELLFEILGREVKVNAPLDRLQAV